MFSQSEKKFLFIEMKDYIKRTRAQLETSLPDEQHQQLEHKIMAATAIINKLQYEHNNTPDKPRNTSALVVDDVKSMREVNKHLLLAIGFHSVEVANDGQQALRMLSNAEASGKSFDLVLSDWQMPNMTGLELLKKIRSNTKLQATPVYLLTALADKKNIIEAIGMGVTGYMVKPITQKILAGKLKDYLPREQV